MHCTEIRVAGLPSPEMFCLDCASAQRAFLHKRAVWHRKGLDLPGRPPLRDICRMVLPGENKRGRPAGRAPEQRAKRGR